MVLTINTIAFLVFFSKYNNIYMIILNKNINLK
jgi:hypothetical protein